MKDIRNAWIIDREDERWNVELQEIKVWENLRVLKNMLAWALKLFFELF